MPGSAETAGRATRPLDEPLRPRPDQVLRAPKATQVRLDLEVALSAPRIRDQLVDAGLCREPPDRLAEVHRLRGLRGTVAVGFLAPRRMCERRL